MKTLTLLLVYLSLCHYSFSQTNLKWQYKVNKGIHSSPILDDKAVYFGSNDSLFYSFNKANGTPNWSFQTRGEIRSTPAIYQQNIIFNSTDGYIYSVNKNTGSLEWKFKTNGEQQADIWDYYLSSAIVKEDKVYIGSGDQHVYCLEAKSGQLVWKFKTKGIVHASPYLDDQKVYIGSFDGYLYALDINNGKEIWKFKTVGDRSFPNGAIQKSVIHYNGALIFGSRDYNLYAVDMKTGKGLWNWKEKDSWIVATALVNGNKLYLGTSDSHKFYTINADNGSIIHEVPLNMRVYASAINYNDDIIFPCFNGKLYKLNSSGHASVLFQTNQSRENYHSIFNEEDHFVEGFQLYGEDFKDAEKKILSLGSILTTPIIENDVIYFGDANGHFYALQMESLNK